MTTDFENTLENKTNAELIVEVHRCRTVAESIWHSITRAYGIEGFTKVLNVLEQRKPFAIDPAPRVLILEAENDRLKLQLDQLKDQIESMQDAEYDNNN